jgi:uncharacterized protein (TIGR03435 family)
MLRKRWLEVVTVAALFEAMLWVSVNGWAQAPGDAPAKLQPMAKSAAPDWEVVPVRPADPDGLNSGYHTEGRDIDIERKTVENMLLWGYGVHKTQIANAPEWVREEVWNAKGYANVPGQPSVKQYQELTRKLLAERFGLVIHTEQREMAVYALTVAKGGPKLVVSKSDPNGQQSGSDGPNGAEVTMQMENCPMSGLAGELTYSLDRPVLDKTGLTGRYDFQLKWTADETKAPTDGSAPPSIFTALQDQLGLKLEPVKALADVLVIDKVERSGAN